MDQLLNTSQPHVEQWATSDTNHTLNNKICVHITISESLTIFEACTNCGLL